MNHDFRSKKKTAVDLNQPAEELLHFDLPDLLKEGQVLVLNTNLGTLALLSTSTEVAHPLLEGEVQFSSSELRIILPLLQQYPHYCPYEVMHASLNKGNTSEAAVERARQRLLDAQFAGVWDFEMRPVRNILSRARFKLRDFQLEVVSISETGYMMIFLSEHHRTSTPPQEP